MIKEIWKDIPGWEGLYRVSTLGRVRAIKRHGKSCNCYILKQHKSIKGYITVELCKNGAGKRMRVHRLVAMTFIPNPKKLPFINHKDENKENNCVENLEWCTAAYNNTYGTRLEKIFEKLSKPVSQYTLDGVLVAAFSSIKEAAEKNNLHRGAIQFCCNGKRKSHGGFIWRYL